MHNTYREEDVMCVKEGDAGLRDHCCGAVCSGAHRQRLEQRHQGVIAVLEERLKRHRV